MLKTTTLYFLLLASAAASAQISLTNAYFPVAGDTLKYGLAADGVEVDLLSPGPDRQWNFGTQLAVASDREVYSMANDEVFTEADLVLDAGDSAKVFFNVTETSFEVIGLRGSVELFPGRVFNAPISPPRPERRAPLVFGNDYSTTTVNQLIVPRSDLPAAVIQQLGVLALGLDSIRLTSTSNRTSTVDGAGTLTINGQTYEVLREKRVETVTTKVEIRSQFLNYTDVTGTIQSLFPDSEVFFGAEEPTTTYYFWAETEKEAIATVDVDESGEQTGLSFIEADSTNSTRGPQLNQSQVKVFPNPARGMATFTIQGIDPGTYTLRLINVLGRQISVEQFRPTGQRTEIDLDVSNLPWGTYLYSLTNERGRILTTRRLLVGR